MSIWLGLFLFGLVWRGFAAEPAADLPAGLYAEIETPRGQMVAQLFFERAPLTVMNFVGLTEGQFGPNPGHSFYDGLVFHRVVPGFVIQGGDPAGTGEGGPGYRLPDELDPQLSHDGIGILSMANDGPDTNGSQFFITLAPTPRLDFLHSVFGKVIRGTDVVSRIRQGDRMTIVIRRVGTAAQQFVAKRSQLDALAAKIPLAQTSPETPPFFADPDGLLPTVPPRAKNFGYKLANVARFTDIRIFARIFSSTPQALGANHADVLQKLSRELGVEQRGALVVYWSDQDTWDIVVGKDDHARFLASKGVRPIEERIGQALAAAKEDTAKWIEASHHENEPLSASQVIKLKVDGVLQEMISAMQPKRQM